LAKKQTRKEPATIAYKLKQLKTMYELMVKIRLFEERVDQLFAEGKIWGTGHLYIGEEATAVGVISALRKDDYITSNHRGHGHCLAKGASLKLMMAELWGKAEGYCRGIGGSMHIADTSSGNLGANGIVGGSSGIAVGSALASVMSGSNRVTACFLGDAAFNQGVVHESLNLAAVWKLPVVFICENNLYGMSVPVSRAYLLPDIADRAPAYGMEGKAVDGNDVLAVYQASRDAAGRARKGLGPELIECKTYRWKGHSKADPCRYRPPEELESWKAKCPIKRFEKYLIDNQVMNPDEIEEKQQRVKEQIEEAVEFARQGAELPFEELFPSVYA
jgi:TPP-dependent pyruvate/acetoin dehydrogenase alpha subunit